jgi:cell division protein ZipA
METSLRLVLLFIGFLIVIGIVWDAKRDKKQSRKSAGLRRERSISENAQFSDELNELTEVETHTKNLRATKSRKNKNLENLELFEDEDLEIFADEEVILKSPKHSSLVAASNRGVTTSSTITTTANNMNTVNSTVNSTNVEPLEYGSASLEPSTVRSTSEQKSHLQAPGPGGKKPLQPLNDIIVLSIMSRYPGTFFGRNLLEAFQEVYLYYGDRQIFHRYENQDGTGQKIFSVASAVEPGYFDLSKMDSYKTPGLTLFFALSRPNQSIAAFEQMLRTAKLLAMRLDGELQDDRRRSLTVQMIEQYRERVRSPAMVQAF